MAQQRGPSTGALRLAFFGPAGAGKTALIRRYLRGSFEEQYQSTVEDFYSLDGVPAELRFGDGPGGTTRRVEILDSGGGHSFPAMRRLAMQRSDAVALVFCPHERDSFDVLRWLRQELLEACTDDAGKPPFVVVANKSDTSPSDESALALRTARDTAVGEWGATFFETSALSGHRVAELFAALFRLGVPPATEQGSQLPARRVQRTGSADEPRHKMPVSEPKRHSCVMS
uniref:GTP-binding protein Di-Ras2-like n=1 Tax=Myxine glutinosa TaxID=7769 RepID=UPI00358FC72F